MNKNKIDKLLDQQILIQSQYYQKFVEKQADIAEKLFVRQNQYLSLSADLHLGHIDILLETAKNFLLIASTVFVTALALDASKITNIDVYLIRKISMDGIIVSALSMVFFLWGRSKVKGVLLASIDKTEKLYGDLVDAQFEALGLTTSKKRSEMKEAVMASISKGVTLKKSTKQIKGLKRNV